MEFCCYLFVLISILRSAYCAAFHTLEDTTSRILDYPTPQLNSESLRSADHKHRPAQMVNVNCQADAVAVPTYAIWLISVAMVAMLIVIICLAVALYMVYNNRKVFAINMNQNKQYVRQESTALTQYNNSLRENENKNNGSTLTVNSGIIEINASSEPVTPTREDAKIILAKKPFRPMGPIIQRGQMDEICKAVLKRVQKSDSASFRDLNELLKGKNDEKFETTSEVINEREKCKEKEELTDLKQELIPDTRQKVNEETEHETTKKKNDAKTVQLEDTKVQSNDKTKELSNGNKKMYAKEETVTKTNNEEKNEAKNEENKAIKIKVQHVERDDVYLDDSNSEAEYDTVPSPVRYRKTSDTPNDLDAIPVYDCPPRRSYEALTRNVIQIDNESQYLLPLTADKCDYVNAKRQSSVP